MVLNRKSGHPSHISKHTKRAVAFAWMLMAVSLADAFLFGATLQSDNLVERSIQHNGLTRWFLEYSPKSLSNISTNNSTAGNAPLVLFMHGATRSMRYSIALKNNPSARRWIELSELHGFVLLAPNGINPRSGDTKGDNQVWNDCNNFGTETVDDVGFLLSLVDWAVSSRGGVDPNRVYLAGVSNGGMLTYRALIETASMPVFAAAAAFIANMPVAEVSAPNHSTPVFIMNGSKDKIVPWDGGPVLDAGRTRSALATRDFWINANQADRSSMQRSALTNRRRIDGCRIISEFYPASHNSSRLGGNNSTSSSPVQFYAMEGGGHMIPYTGDSWYSLISRLLKGPPCRDANGVDLAWEFMSRYSLEK